MSYNPSAQEFMEGLAECETVDDKRQHVSSWLRGAYDEGCHDGYNNGYDDAKEEFYQPPNDDVADELGWLRTRIERGEKTDALMLVDEIQRVVT